MKKPNFFIVGAPKCGTTSLYFYLLNHPEVYLPQTLKEINYISGVRAEMKTDEDYLRLYEGSENYPVRMDISTSYLYESQTAEKIRAMFGKDVKIIVMLRNPVDAAYSLWKQLRHYGQESLSFEESIAAEEQRRNNEAIRSKLPGWAPNFFYTDRYIYTPQLQRYFDQFPKEQIAIFIYEEFFGDLDKGWRDMCSFLRIDSSYKPPSFGAVHNPSGQGVKSRLLHRALYENLWWKKPFTWAIPQERKERLRLALDDVNKIKNSQSTPLSQTLEEYLKKRFSPDVRVLEKHLNRNLTDIWM